MMTMMANYADEKKIEKSSMQWVPVISGSSDISMLIYSLDIITKVGKNLPILFLSLASLNVLLAANDFLANNIEFGILNSLFAANGLSFLYKHTKVIEFNHLLQITVQQNMDLSWR